MTSLEEYKKNTLSQLVLTEPDTFVGGCDEIDGILPIIKDGKILVKSCIYIPAIIKLFDEILVNARDQKVRLDSIKNKKEVIPVLNIKVEYDNGSWSIYNDGNGIDIAEHPTEKDEDGNKIWIPELILGNLLTSKNYGKDGKTTGGKNGFGAKLVNLFSTEFKVETVDHIRGLKYVQTFSNNMSIKTTPKITNYKSKPYTKITWVIDFNRFNIKNYSNDMIDLMIRRIYDIAGITDKSINIYYNNEKLSIKSFDNYVDLYLNEENKIYEKIHDRWEFSIASSKNDRFEHYSFVNGIYTLKGGKHVDFICKQLITGISNYIAKKHKKSIPDNYIKNHLKLFINCTIEDPSFDSQSKEILITTHTKFGSKPIISDKCIKNICEKLDIVTKVLSFTEFKENKQLKKNDGKKKNKINVDKLDDANWAGTSKSDQTILILTEGDSAKTMAISGLSVVGRNEYGVFPLRGKVLNVKEASLKQMNENNELNNLIKIIGLEHQKEYENTNSLRYGKIMIMTDQDHDGSHIKALIILIFETLWPSLLKLNYITSMITPIVKVSKGSIVHSFYTLKEYNDWKSNTSNSNKWNVKYYKGLGTSTSNEAKEYFKNINCIQYNYNENTEEKINLAFKKDLADERKKWLYKYDENLILDNIQSSVGIDEFIDKELIHFSNSDTKRSIGSVCDGLKPSQRKILFSCFKRNLKSEIKVAQLSGYVSEHSAYHHGEASLQSTMISMAQTFVGSNNLNLLKPNGQFGSRIMGGKDSASPRYIHTELCDTIYTIFPKEDMDLLNYLNDDGLMIEPKYYCPIIPVVLINGMVGIGTGFSTNIPQYNPKDIIFNIKNKLSGNKYKEINPWYKNFTGKIEKISNTKYITKGCYEINKTKIEITELPIGVWTNDYKSFLDKNVNLDKKDKNKFILDYEDHSTDDTVRFILKVLPTFISSNKTYPSEKLNSIEKGLKLFSFKTTTNLHLYSEENKIKKYKDIYQIMDEFYNVRYNLYIKRKKYQLNKLNNDKQILMAKQKFIQYVINDKIVIYKNKLTNIIESLKKYEFPYIITNKIEENYTSESYNYLTSIPIHHFTEEKIDELNNKIKDINSTYDKLNNQTVKDTWINELDILNKSL
tara:strand:- start:2098 stop:5442 length:3345 start_codon:yes stop_codon:yes gene_type:complete